MHVIRRSSGIVVAALALLAPGALYAQNASENQATAEALFREARSLMEAGSVAEACEKFAASQRIDPALGTLLNLARCHEQLGRTASAWAEFTQAASEARRAGQKARQKEAEERAIALEPKLVRLLIEVPEEVNVPALEVKRDGLVLDPAAWNTAVPVDPGLHAITADAPGKVSWSNTIDVKGEGQTTRVTIPLLVDAAAPPPPAPPSPQPATAPSAPPPPPSQPPASQHASVGTDTVSGMGMQRTIGLIVGGAGLAGIAAGSYFGLTARSKWNDADCPNNVCPTSDRQTLAEDAKTYANGSTVAFIAGGALLATGAALYFTAPSRPSTSAASTRSGPTSTVAVAARATPNAASLTIRGSF